MNIKQNPVIVMVLFLLMLGSCVEEPYFASDREEQVKGQGVKVSFYLTVPDRQVSRTRSSFENSVSDVYLLVTDSEDRFLECIEAVDISGDTQKFYALLTPRNESGKIYIIANAPNIVGQKKNSWVAGMTTLGDIKSDLLKSPLSGGSAFIHTQPVMAPMISKEPAAFTGIDKNMELNVLLERITAKITIVSEAGVDFLIEGANLVNVPDQGYLFPGMDVSDIPLKEYAGENPEIEGNYSPEFVICDAVSQPLYCYESPASNNTYVIVKVFYKNVTGYYRINLTDKVTAGQLDLKRNHWYVIKIKHVTGAGYATPAEAKINPALNETGSVDIVVTDPYSHDIVSNGNQYLGVSNSKLFVHKKGQQGNILAATINYTVPQAGSGYNWSTAVIIPSNGISVVGGNDLPLANTNNREIRINIAETVSSGTLTIRIGDLSKVIEIEKRGNILAFEPPMEFADYVTAAKGNIESNPSGGKEQIGYPGSSWCRLAADDSEPAVDEERIVSPAGKIFLCFGNNYAYSEAGNLTKSRSGEVFLAREDEQGRTKVLFTQEGFDMYSSPVVIRPYTYVGTFHRAGETGERIIRIAAENPFYDQQQEWRAIVVAGEEWIRLSTNVSNDPGIKLDPYGAGDNPVWNTSALIESNSDKFLNPRPGYDIDGKSSRSNWSTVVWGTPKATGKSYSTIYFRVSLTSELPGGPAGKPRYGLIALTHKQGVHFIYVRQGEAPDYLMRPTDDMYYDPRANGYYGQDEVSGRVGNVNSSIRQLMRRDDPRGNAKPARFSPYNLTAPDIIESGLVDYGPKGYREVRYPSQGGFYFRSSSTEAMAQTKGSGNIVLSSNTRFPLNVVSGGFNDPSPGNYRKPLDGSNDRVRPFNDDLATQNNQPDYTPTPWTSEFRRSLWLYPKCGAFQVLSSARFNAFAGYYADGYFDRRPIMASDGKNSAERSMVKGPCEENGEWYNAAYMGYLFFNPNDNTSVFFPEPGYFTAAFVNMDAGNIYAERGRSGIYQANTIAGSPVGPDWVYFWTFQMGSIGAGRSDILDNYFSHNDYMSSVRCVVDE